VIQTIFNGNTCHNFVCSIKTLGGKNAAMLQSGRLLCVSSSNYANRA
jgi:hypothetical protein